MNLKPTDSRPWAFPLEDEAMLPGWNRIAIAGKPVDVFESTSASPAAILYLHDRDGTTPATNISFTDQLRSRQLACVAPITGESWWVDRICPPFDPILSAERYLLDHIAPWMTAHWRAAVGAIAVAGVGMGGQGAVRLGLRHPSRFPIVASLDGAFDFHELFGRGGSLDAMYASREDARQDTAILQVHPHEWPQSNWFSCSFSCHWYRGNDRLHEKLAAMGVPHTARFDEAVDVLPMLDFLGAALARESKRLL
jgi:S-formylglutathione hydrolase